MILNLCAYLYVDSSNSFIDIIIEIHPCGENRPLRVLTTDNGFIDSSVLAIDEDAPLSCEWKLKVKKDKSLMITAHDIKIDHRWVSSRFTRKYIIKI